MKAKLAEVINLRKRIEATYQMRLQATQNPHEVRRLHRKIAEVRQDIVTAQAMYEAA